MSLQKQYKFTVLCSSGERKTIEFYALSFKEARKFLEDYVKNN